MKWLFCASLAVCCLAVYARGGEQKRPACKRLYGRIVWTVIEAPNDPFGRVLGSATGSLRGATSAIIQKLTPGQGGVLKTSDLDIFVVGPQDMLVGTAEAVFTPDPAKPGEVFDTQTITFTGGSGKFAGATGSMRVHGRGFNLGGGPGDIYFDVEYHGEVCGPNLRGDRD